MRSSFTTLTALLMIVLSITEATTRKVPADYATIQLAINAGANGDTVLVAEGTYFENLTLTKKIVLGSFFIIDKDTSHISRTIIDGGSPLHADSGSVFLVLTGTDTSTVIKGFTIQNGSGTNFSSYILGGGISIIGGGATISNNIIKNNKCTSSVTGTGAAGIDIETGANSVGPAPWVITNNTIAYNISTSTAPSTKGSVDGGGLGLTGHGRVTNNFITNNSASGSSYGAGGGVAIWSYTNGTDIVFNNNIVMSNSASAGGALNMWVNLPYSQMNVSFANNIIVGNSTPGRDRGGVIVVNSGNYTWVNNTIANNSGRIMVSLNAKRGALTLRLLNNIIWNPESWAEIFSFDYAEAQYNCIRGGYPGVGNFSANPYFLFDGSYSLSDTSYCIARGVDSAQFAGSWYGAPKRDINGTTRSNPSGSFPDLGAVEHSSGTPRTLSWQPFILQFMSGGINRSCIVEIPFIFASVKNLPVVFDLHAYGDDASFEQNYNRTHLLGDSVGFITVYPEAITRIWNSGISANFSWPTPTADDVAFISAIIDTLYQRYSIDTTRVYSCGMSNGGFMSLMLGGKLSRKIAAVASVGGVLTTTSAAAYAAARPVPVLMMHGTSDKTVPFNGGVTNWYSVDQVIEFWRQKNACFQAPVKTDVPNTDPTDNSTVEVYTYKSDSNISQVKLYKVIDGLHVWPGGPPFLGGNWINRDIDARVENWNFFKQYSLLNTASFTGVESDILLTHQQ
jgi:poly(3-hydroxybutyrate) depolymerase